MSKPVITPDFRAAPPRDLGVGIVPLYTYQHKYIIDHARIKVACWCRQAGKDHTTSLEAVLDALETAQNWYIVSLTLRQAEATIKKVQQHCRAFNVLAAALTIHNGESTFWSTSTQSMITIKTFSVILPNGAEIQALPGADPDALAGLTGNVIFTEMALFPDNGIHHWRVIFPLITRGFKIRAISTPRGPETRFAQLRRNAQGRYSVHNITIHDAVAGGLKLTDEQGRPSTIDDLRAAYNDEQGWSREYLLIEGHDMEQLIDWRYIQGCRAPGELLILQVTGPERLREQLDPAHNPALDILAKMQGQGFFGWDIADSPSQTADLTVIPIAERVGDVLWDRCLILMHRIDDLNYQADVVRHLLRAGAIGNGDKTGLGRGSCQTLEREFPLRFVGRDFGGLGLAEVCSKLRDGVQAMRLRYPPDHPAIENDLAALFKAPATKRLSIVKTRNPELPVSHCDIAIAHGLMFDAASEVTSTLVDGMRISSGSRYDERGASWDNMDEDDDVVLTEERGY